MCVKYMKERRGTADGTNKHSRNKSYYNNVYNYNNNNFKIRTSAKHWANHLTFIPPLSVKATFGRHYHSDSIEEKAENYTITFYSH